MTEQTISGLADKAATDLGLTDTSPVPVAAPSGAASPATDTTTSGETKTPGATPASAPATEPTSKEVLLAGLRAALERKEVTPEELTFVNSKLQSSFGKLKATEKAIATSIQEVLDDKGVILPDGKTVADVMNEPDGGRSFASLIKSVVGSEIKPLMDEKAIGDLRADISSQLVSAVEANPDIEPLLPQIGQHIEANPLLKEAVSATRFIPLVLTGVARDIQWQQEKAERIRLEGEVEKYKKALADAEEVAKVGSSTSRAATSPTPTHVAGTSDNVRSLAERLYDSAVAAAKDVN